MIKKASAIPANWTPCEICKKDVPASKMLRHIEKTHQMKLGLPATQKKILTEREDIGDD